MFERFNFEWTSVKRTTICQRFTNLLETKKCWWHCKIYHWQPGALKRHAEIGSYDWAKVKNKADYTHLVNKPSDSKTIGFQYFGQLPLGRNLNEFNARIGDDHNLVDIRPKEVQYLGRFVFDTIREDINRLCILENDKINANLTTLQR